MSRSSPGTPDHEFLADEHLDEAIVRWLGSTGHDVLWVAQSYASATDEQLMEIAHEQQRVVITKDMDFGELVFLWRLHVPGVVLLRLADLPTRHHLSMLQRYWSTIESRLKGNFIVVSSGGVRIRPIDPLMGNPAL